MHSPPGQPDTGRILTVSDFNEGWMFGNEEETESPGTATTVQAYQFRPPMTVPNPVSEGSRSGALALQIGTGGCYIELEISYRSMGAPSIESFDDSSRIGTTPACAPGSGSGLGDQNQGPEPGNFVGIWPGRWSSIWTGARRQFRSHTQIWRGRSSFNFAPRQRN